MDSSELQKKACDARKYSHSPYSGHKVGAAVRVGKPGSPLFIGANIENASFGATVCAERVAIWKAMSEFPGEKIVEVAVCTDQNIPWPPCGLCLQVMAEFCAPDTKVHLCDLQKIVKTVSFKELLPLNFNPEHLKR